MLFWGVQVKRFIVLGSTGSIGCSSLDVIASNPDEFMAAGLAAGSSVDLMCEQVERFKPQAVSMYDPESADAVRSRVGDLTTVYTGDAGLEELIRSLDADAAVNGLVGSAGMMPTIVAMESGLDVLLANKETMVMAGEIVVETVKRTGRRIVPIDSEMSAIYQCLKGEPGESVKRLILTASGGPFTDWTKKQLADVTVKQALNHPTWNMGTKNTIDSATMMNKGLEVIEASFLFDTPGEKIDVAIHRTSVHSFVEFIDGSILCQLSKPDMRLAIQYAMTDPDRLPSPYGGLDFSERFSLTFEPPNMDKFPCLGIAYDVLSRGGTAAAAMNGANEAAVEAFVSGAIAFNDIPVLISRIIEEHDFIQHPTVDDLIETDITSKRKIHQLTQSLSG